MTIEDLKNHCEKQIDLCSKLNDYKHLEEHQLILNLIKENQELKKQLEEKIKIGVADHKYSSQCEDKVITMETQQKEFIKYLKGKIKYFKDLEQFAIKVFNNKAVINLDLVKISIDEDRIVIENLEEVLQKYKEIIGDDK